MRTTIYPVMKSRILTLLMFVSFAFSAFAYDFEVGDFQYNIISLSDRTAEIVGTTNNECEQVNIPSEVIFNGIGIHVISIGQKVFSENKNLKEVVVGDGIRKIDNSFYNCKNLSKVELGAHTDSLVNAFNSCTNLKEVTFKSSQCYISGWTFVDCHNLSIINIPSMEAWCSYVFQCSQFVDNHTVSLYIAGIPIDYVHIPNSVTHIGKYQFTGIKSITKLDMPSTIKTIGEYSFANTGINNILIPESCDTIMDCAFQGLQLEELRIPANVRYIGDLTEGRYGSSYGKIGKLVFSETTDSIVLGQYNETLTGFFEYMSVYEIELRRPLNKMRYIASLSGAVTIDRYSICESLKKVIVGKNFTDLTSGTFLGCTGLDSLIIEDSDAPITFVQNSQYEERVRHERDYIYEYRPRYIPEFKDCPLKYVYIGRNINYQEPNRYWNVGKRQSPFSSKCTVKEIAIGNNVTSLPDNNFFKNCPIETICIGERLNEIPEGTFSHTENCLKTITLHNETPPTYISGFSNYDYVNCKLFVPHSAMDLYKSSEPWGKFWNINDLETTGIDNIKTEKDLSKNHIYSINGTKVIAPSKGIYIINGKKVLYK